MSIEKNINKEDVILECPYCMVCSIKVSAEEWEAVQAGQQMIEVCSICGKEVKVHELRKLY